METLRITSSALTQLTARARLAWIGRQVAVDVALCAVGFVALVALLLAVDTLG